MIDINNVPAVPGLSFRNYQGESDHAAIAAVLTASDAADNMKRNVERRGHCQRLPAHDQLRSIQRYYRC